MATVLNGKFTIREVLLITQQYARSRFKNKKRDVVKRIIIKKIKTYHVDRRKAPSISYFIESKSWPNYKPYFNPKSGRKYQRRVSHHYDVVLQMDRLSIDTKAWRGRLGSSAKWEMLPPQNKIKQIYKGTREKWKKKYKGNPKGLKEEIDKHKKRAQYLDVGDYNSRVKGINGDFKFRLAYAWNQSGHLFGKDIGARNVPALKTNPNNIVFFPKHFINVIEILMARGILKEG